jgi:hypothetical protein
VEGAEQKRPNPQLERWLKAFERSAAASEVLAQAIEGLVTLIAHPKDGLIKTFDDLGSDMAELTTEIRGLRKDMRAAAKTRGLANVFELLGGG